MIGTLLVALLSFYVEILDTVEFRGIPEEIVFDITDDIWAEPRFWIDRHHIFVASPPYTCILMFSRTGDFIKKIGKKGEAPEEFLGIVDIYGFSDTIYVYSIANKITLLNLDGTYVRSGLLTYLPSLPEAIKVNSKSLLVIGENWDYIKEKKYKLLPAVYKYNRTDFQFIASFFTPPYSSYVFKHYFRMPRVYAVDIAEDEIFIAPRFDPVIYIYDIKTGKERRVFKLSSCYLGRPPPMDLERYLMGPDTARKVLYDWKHSHTFIENLFYIPSKEIIVLAYREAMKNACSDYLMILNSYGEIIQDRIKAPGRLVFKDTDENLYFVADSISIIIAHIK